MWRKVELLQHVIALSVYFDQIYLFHLLSIIYMYYLSIIFKFNELNLRYIFIEEAMKILIFPSGKDAFWMTYQKPPKKYTQFKILCW